MLVRLYSLAFDIGMMLKNFLKRSIPSPVQLEIENIGQILPEPTVAIAY
jgi:hypothetical protein